MAGGRGSKELKMNAPSKILKSKDSIASVTTVVKEVQLSDGIHC